MATNLNQPPSSLKAVSHYLKVAVEHDNRDQVIAYWARMGAVQKALTIDKSSPEAKMFVVGLLDWLERQKKTLAGNEAVTIEAAGEAHIENYALKLFNWADQSDRNGVFNKNVVKAFYTAGILFDILESLRPPLSDEFTSARKYAKWKAAYIHNCLKNGETPIPGGVQGEDDEENEEDGTGGAAPASNQPSSSSGYGFGFVDPSSSNRIDPGSGPGYPTDNTPQYPPPNQGYQPPPPQAYQPPTPTPAPAPVPAAAPANINPYADFGGGSDSNAGSSLSVEQIAKAQKYCKWAGSALNFDDVNSAIENLEKALHLLKTGQELG